MKRFALYEQSVADPEGLIVAADITDIDHVVKYSDLSVVKQEIAKLEYGIAYRAGQQRESVRAKAFLREKGWTPEEILQFLFWREK